MVISQTLKSRVVQMISVILMLSASTNCYSAENTNSSKLILMTDKSESIVGRPIRVDLYGINLKTKISDVNITALKKDFGIIIDYVINNTSDNRWPNKKIQILKFKIYPRKVGTLTIPKITTGKISTKEKTISIIKDKISAPSITLQTHTPYERQQFTALIKVISPEPTARLSIDEKVLINGFDSLPLSFKRKKIKKGIYELQIGWSLTAIKSGQFNLELPVIDYSVSGVLRRKFHLPSQHMDIKVLPSYLPPTIPIGKISIHSIVTQQTWLRANTIAYWNIKLSGNTNSSYQLPPILRQIKTNSKINFFPANSLRSYKIQSDKLYSEVIHSIPFKPLGSGVLELPKIQLQYFDPSNGKIKTITHQMTGVFILSLYLELLLGTIIVLIIIYIFKLTNRQWRKFKHSNNKREQALLCLKDENPDSLRKAIKLLIEAESWPYNMTVNQWGEHWRNKYKTNNDFGKLIKTLSSYFYSNSKLDNNKNLNLQLTNLVKNKNLR